MGLRIRNKLLLLLVIILLSISNISSTSAVSAGDLEGKERKYKITYDIKLTSEDGSNTFEEHLTSDWNIKIKQGSSENEIIIFEEKKEDTDQFYFLYGQGTYMVFNSGVNQVSKQTRNESLIPDYRLFEFKIITIISSICRQVFGTSYFENYLLVADPETYFASIAGSSVLSDYVDEINYDTTSFELVANYEDLDIFFTISSQGLSDVSEIWEMEYDTDGLLKSLNYELWVNYDGVELIKIEYQIKSGFFRGLKLPAPSLGIFLASFIMIVVIGRNRYKNKID